ncbi:hypothetical protein HMPREF0083_01535 [Aneurinibacillus aneurinilyticus ATCC 12856]|uniref:Uncharacterized protein n=1 Tax=Aneurinibacillus aneurinilyticus ATCC 12856 TaxID=649747 RepID=U1X754_ANEAE|nr:hypothetical protein HMPREF0083_01535 [Aneurinibacillus aneurinilyticus ATCC 12856]
MDREGANFLPSSGFSLNTYFLRISKSSTNYLFPKHIEGTRIIT